ncbi:MAG: glycosyltransferase family 4 protein [Cyclobacteriaceae bacterium]
MAFGQPAALIAVDSTAIFFCMQEGTTLSGIRSNAFLCIVKVLILHQHFKVPEQGGAIRSYYLAKALVEKGIHTVVITAHNEPEYRKEQLEGIEVHYLPIPYDNRFGFYERIFSFYRFIVKSVKLAAKVRDADLCYAISTPLTTGIAAMRIRRRYKIPYIFEVGDLWPDAPIKMGVITNPFSKYWLYRLEKAIYRNGSSIVALSAPIRNAIRKKISEKSIHVLPNMSDTDFFRPEKKNPALDEKFQVRGKFVVSYIGAIGVANGLQYFIDCAAATGREGLPIHFFLCGDGAMVEDLKQHADRLALTNLTFIPFLNRQGVWEMMNLTDANFICYKPLQILETGSPNKYFDGLAAGKLTIINFGGWIRDEIEKEGCGIYVNPEKPDDFVRSIKPFLSDPKLLNQYQHAGRELAESRYSRRMLGQKFLEIVRSGQTKPFPPSPFHCKN